jgi:Na+/proline symporter
LPTGLAGLVVAAILAAAMANLSAAFNSLASSSVVDFYKPFLRPAADESHYLRVSRLLTLVWGGVLIGIALLAQQLHTSVLELALTIASVPYGCMLGIFLLGVLTRRTTGGAAVLGAAAGFTVLLAVMGLTSVAWTWYVAIETCVTFAVGLAASWMFADQPANAR